MLSMCRLFGQISLRERNAADLLVGSEFSLLKQSSLNKKSLQKDGWGLVWLRSPFGRYPEGIEIPRRGTAKRRLNGGWDVVKSARPVFEEKARFSAAARGAESPLIIAHIRRASNPKKLRPSRLNKPENSQPFSHDGLVFAHNGTLNIPDEVARTLGRLAGNLKGVNDSEVLFWLFVKTWEVSLREIPRRGTGKKPGRDRWRKVFRRMISRIESVWDSIPKEKRKFKAPYSGLNFLASDGRVLAAQSFYDRPDGKSLCGQGRPYFEMCYRVSEGRVAVASEPLDNSPGWRPIPNRHLLVVEKKRESLDPAIVPLSR